MGRSKPRKPSYSHNQALTHQVVLPDALPEEVGESAWIEVIQHMDNIYADLVEHQVALEDRNEALEAAYRELHRTHEELKQTQRQLIQAEKMASLGRLVAGVAHELNNPISFIQGNAFALERHNTRLQSFFAELEKLNHPVVNQLREQNRLNTVLQDLNPLVEGTKEGAERVTEIVQNLLRFTTPQTRAVAPFDLAALIRHSMQWVCRSNQIEMQQHLELPDSLEITGYEGLVHQILVNLIQNAIDAVEPVKEPTLWVSVQQIEHPTAQQVAILVRDNGPGIPRKHQAAIFDPFFTTKPPGKGIGLGLYISYLLATEQCGGNLTVECPPRGGAEFTLILPTAIRPNRVDGGGNP
ncbi:MAG TPA: hypothetical protein DCZ12_14755 [Gammaproteobacteria bacterium]|nr:hypothetical protein [Gammaproteobacteria bacterium]